MNPPERPSRWALWLPLGLFALFVAVVLVSLLRPADRAVKSTMIGRPLPQFALSAASADRPGLARADLADGKPHLLNIFASWCVPCAVEAPQLAALRARGIDVVGIAIRDQLTLALTVSIQVCPLVSLPRIAGRNLPRPSVIEASWGSMPSGALTE